MAIGFEGLGPRRTLIGLFKSRCGFHIEVDGSGARWDVDPDHAHRKLLYKRVRATGWETGPNHMIVIEMKLAD